MKEDDLAKLEAQKNELLVDKYINNQKKIMKKVMSKKKPIKVHPYEDPAIIADKN